MKNLIGFILLLLPIISIADIVEIRGNALFFAQEQIQVLRYNNLLSKEKEVIAQTIIEDNGDYFVSFNLDFPQEIIIQIEMRELTLHLHPATKVNLDFLPIEKADNQRAPFRVKTNYKNFTTNIAQEIDYLNLESAFARHQLTISKNEQIGTFYKSFFDSIEIELQPILQTDSLFSIHFKYFKANSFLQSQISLNKLFSTYILNQPIYYQNKQYLTFFNIVSKRKLFDFFLKNKSSTKKTSNEYYVYEAFLNLLKTDSLFKNKELRSLALLNFCINSSSSSLLNGNIKNGILQQMSNSCNYTEQKTAAQNYIQQKEKLKLNSLAPDIELTSSSGASVTLSSFRGQITYLGFINSKSSTCARDLQIIDIFKKKYKKVNFLFIVCDRDSLEMNNLPKESSSLKYLFINKNYEALRDYQVWDFPIYYLIDKQGYLIQSPAKKPENIIDDFKLIFTKKSLRRKY